MMIENRSGKKGISHSLVMLIKIAVSVGAIAWLLSTIHWSVLAEKLMEVNWLILWASFAIFSVWLIPCSLRWRQVAGLCGYPLSVGESIGGYLVGSFFNVFLPTGRGGDVARGVIASRHHGFSLAGVMGTVFVERFIGLMVTVCLVVGASAIAFSKVAVLKNTLISASVLIVFLLAFVFACVSKRLRRPFIRLIHGIPFPRVWDMAEDVFKVLDTCRDHSRVMMSAVGFSLLNQLVLIISGYTMALAIPGFNAPWYSFPVVIPLIFIAVLLPSIGGYGVREAGFVVFFGWFGINEDTAAAYALFQLLFLWAFALIGAILFAAGRPGEHSHGQGSLEYP